jgi:hypothetical protein
VSCSEIRSLLSLRSLDLLEEAERAKVEGHLAACATCRLELGSHDEVAQYFKTARRDEKPPERVWDALAKKLDAAPVATVAAPSRPLLQLACATCSGGLEEAVYCASCLAPHHAECFTKCTVHGCSGTKIVSSRAPRRSLAAPLVLVGLAAVVTVFCVQRGYEDLLEESHKNVQLENDIRKFFADRWVAPRLEKEKEKAPEKAPDIIDVACDNEDLHSVLDRVGERAHQNIVVDPDVHDKVNLRLSQVHWRDAVEVIAQFAKCDVTERGNVIVLVKRVEVPIPIGPAEITPPKPVIEAQPRETEDEKHVELKLEGVIESTRARLASTAVINGRVYHERDEIRGKDGKGYSPKLFVAKIRKDEVDVTTGSLDGAKTVLAIGH